MPKRPSQIPSFKPARDTRVEWETFKGGWNTFSRPTELKDNELAQADNLMLVGTGVPTGRWGSATFHLAGEAGRIRLLDAFYVGGGAASLASTNYLLAITDSGYLTRRTNASYTIITGASFISGVNYQAAQLDKNTYIASATLPFVRFDGANLIPYVGLSVPTNVSVAQLSAATGFNTYSWYVTAVSRTGETLTSVQKTLASLPLDLTLTSIKVSWNAVSAAAGVLQGYNIYRGNPGDERLLATVDNNTTQYYDTGAITSFTLFPPNADTTSGIRAKYILRFDDRLILAGIIGDPSKVYISGRYPYQDRFTAADGGGYIYVSPDDGDEITGLGVALNQQTGVSSSSILVYKNNSVHRVQIGTVQLGNFLILDPAAQILTSANGCSSADTIVAVENDVFHFGRKGLYVVGQEPNFLNQIRTNELSARIRPYIQSLSDSDFKEACAGYIDNKYLLSFPTKRETIIYDRERLAFMGPWKTPWGVTKWFKYYDTDGTERWLAGSDSGPYVRDFSTAYVSDSSTAIAKTLRTKKSDLGSWSIFKILKLFYVLFRNIRGTVTVNLRLEDRTGITTTTKSFNITAQLGNGGWGADQWGNAQWGNTAATLVLTGDEIVRWSQIYKNMRVVQIEILSTDANANWEFLGLHMTAQGLGDSSLPATTRV